MILSLFSGPYNEHTRVCMHGINQSGDHSITGKIAHKNRAQRYSCDPDQFRKTLQSHHLIKVNER